MIQGWGILVLVFIVVGFLGGEVIGQPFGWLFAAAANLIAGWRLNREARAQELGAAYLNSFSWIPMEWWSLPMVGLAVFVWANNLH